MSTAIIYQIFLRKNATEYYSPDGSTGRKPFLDCIENMQEINIGLSRHDKYEGVFIAVTAPLIFHGRAAQVIEAEFDSNFINAYIEIEIEMRKSTDMRFYPAGVFSPDWKTFKKVSHGVECELIESGVVRYLDANESTLYRIGMTEGFAATGVVMDGIGLSGYQEWVLANFKQDLYANAYMDKSYIPFGMSNNSSSYSEISAYQNLPKGISKILPIAETNQPLIGINYNNTLTFSGDFFAYYAVEASSSRPVTLKLYASVKASPSSTTPLSEVVLWSDPAGAVTAGNDRVVNIIIPNVSVTAAQGNILELYLGDNTYSSGTPNFKYTIDGNGYLRVDTSFKLPQTIVLGKRYGQTFNLLVQKMTEYKYTADAPILNDPNYTSWDYRPYRTIITSDNALRGDNVQFITVSMDSMYKDLSSRDNLGLGVENNKIIIRDLYSFYQKDLLIADLGSVDNCEISPESDKIFNNLTIGFDKEADNDINDIYTFCDAQEYKSKVRDKFGDWDLKSDFVADMNEIEKGRSARDQKNSNNTSTDNSTNYLLAISNVPVSGNYLLYRPGTWTGFPTGKNPYNLPLSPTRSLFRKLAEVRSRLYKIPETLTFQAKTKNVVITSNLGAGSVTEGVDIYYNVVNPLYQPIYFEFDCKNIPKNFLYLLQNNRYGVIRFNWKGRNYDGFIMEVGVKGKDVSKFKLLSSPNNTW